MALATAQQTDLRRDRDTNTQPAATLEVNGTDSVISLRDAGEMRTANALADRLSWSIAMLEGDVIVGLHELESLAEELARVLVVGLRLLTRQGRRLRLRGASPAAALIIEALGLSTLVESDEAPPV